MSARNSTEAAESITWQTATVPLGMAGLDLRQPADPRALARLINARFRNERTVERRAGHVGYLVRDNSSYPQSTGVTLALNPVEWIYGYGQLLNPPVGTGEIHYPQPGFARGIFDYNGEVVWTGDRLLVMRDDAPALGQSAFWNTGNSTAALSYGVPAYLPVQTDSAPPDTVTGNYVETCLTDKVRVTVATGGSALTAWVTNRDTGVLISKATLGGGSAPVDVRVFKSGTYVMCVWRDSGNTNLYTNYWTGSTWVGATIVDTGVNALDVALVDGGFHLLWRVSGALYMGKYAAAAAQGTPYAFRTALTTTGNAPNGPVAFAVSPTDGAVRVVWQASDGLKARDYTAALTAGTQFTLDAATTWNAGLTVSCRRIQVNGVNSFVIHAGRTPTASGIVNIWETQSSTTVRSDTRYNCNIASKSFVVGNEVFCWMRAKNSQTLFLFAGAFQPQMCGIADREEAPTRTVTDGVLALSMLSPDPRSPYQFTWARPFTTGQAYIRAGNVRLGDMNFLPKLSATRFGKSMYTAGSLVRNWDGSELGDAGFHDYTLITSITGSNSGGSLTGLSGKYQYRVYPVRYNRMGERFQGAAITAVQSDNNIWQNLTLTFYSTPATNSSDVVWEIYRTEAGGTTFYLEGTVANSFASSTLSFVSGMSDAALITQPADPHETGVASADEVEEFGPLGCSFLVVAGDRLWGAGGQVPRGQVQFSKLKEPGEGAGFDALAGTQQIDNDGGDITSIMAFSDAIVIFEAGRVFVLFGTGPDNYGQGNFSTPQLVLADGATTHYGTAATQAGLVFWGVDGPRLLTAGFQVQNISLPVQALTSTLEPSGVRVDLARQEVVWYTETGDAVLLNYQSGARWAQWIGLKIAGCSANALVTTAGRLLIPDDDVGADDGAPFEFLFSTGELRPEEILQGATQVRRFGLTGRFDGEHNVRFRVFYDGSPMWSEEFTWEPATETWLTLESEIGALTPAQADALTWDDHSGAYHTHRRLRRQTCDYFRVEVSDINSDHVTFTPHELVCELGRKPGLGRTAVNTFKDS